jgi:putative heme-binding domain-containing protein
VVWKEERGGGEWNGWLPTFDLTAANEFTKGSAAHETWRQILRTNSGNLTLRAQLDLSQMLRPAVQPGAKIDYEWPPEQVFLKFAASKPFSLETDSQLPQSKSKAGGRHEISVSLAPALGKWLPVEISLGADSLDPALTLTWHTAEDTRERPLPLHRILLPWAVPAETNLPPSRELGPPPELAGANWLNGRRLFFSETAQCSKCHVIRGEGHKVGPDLSNLVQRDYASVRRDILYPNAALNPDHLAYEVQLKDGESVTGVLQQDTAEAVVVAAAGVAPVRIPKARVEGLRPSGLSLMPEGLGQAVGEGGIKDLMAFLLVSPVEVAPLATTPPIAARSRKEIEALRQSMASAGGSGRREEALTQISNSDRSRLTPAATGGGKPMRILLVAGPKDHGPDEHDYPLWQKRWAALLGLGEGVKVDTAFGWPSAEQLAGSDVMVFYSNNPGWSQARAAELERFQKGGGGLVYLHYAVDGHKDVEALSERIGLAWRGGQSKFRHGGLDLVFGDPAHPITRGFKETHFHDESYWNLVGDPAGIKVLASGTEEGKSQPLMWTRENGTGRVFVSILGHYTWTFDDPAFRLLILRGICWAAHQPEDRLSELAFVGARMGE